MEYVRVVKGKGCKYVVNNNLFSQYCIRNSKSYVKCDVCSASGYIDVTNLLQLSRIHNMMISHKKRNVYSSLTIVVSVLQKNPLNHWQNF